MQRFQLFGFIAVLIALSLVLSACGMIDDMMGSPNEADDPGSMEDSEDMQAAEPAIDPAIAALLPSEPAPVGSSFRPDSAQVVGMTGRPQLLEFFTYW